MFREVHIVAALARTTGASNTCRPLTNNEAFKGPLVMADPLITGCELTRNCALATNYTQNQENVKTSQAKMLGWTHSLFFRLYDMAAEIRQLPPLVFGGVS